MHTYLYSRHLLTLALAFASLVISFAQEPALRPVFEGVDLNPSNGRAQAIFGYENENAEAVSVPIGPDNSFDGSKKDLGQPTTFLPGQQIEVACLTLKNGVYFFQILIRSDARTFPFLNKG